MLAVDKRNFLKILKVSISAYKTTPSTPAASHLPLGRGIISLLTYFEPFLQPSASRASAVVSWACSWSVGSLCREVQGQQSTKTALISHLHLFILSTNHLKGKEVGGSRVGLSPPSAYFKRAPKIQNSLFFIFK